MIGDPELKVRSSMTCCAESEPQRGRTPDTHGAHVFVMAGPKDQADLIFNEHGPNFTGVARAGFDTAQRETSCTP